MANKENKINYSTPIYLQLREIVRNKIDEDEYPPGTAIPSENKLAETYGINRITVRNAVNALVNEGKLRRVHGKGVFVVGNKVEHNINEFDGFVKSITPKSRTVIKQLSKTVRLAGDKYARIFRLSPNDPIFEIRQIVLNKGIAIFYDEIYVPANIVPNFENIDCSVFSIADIFGFYEICISFVRQSLEIVECGAKIRKLLSIPEGVASMWFENTYYDDSGRVIEHGNSYIRSDLCNFKVRL